jgi:hypothetical protein
MNLIDFTRNGGFRLKQYTLRLMQEAYFLLLKAMVGFMNIPEAGNYIISGCTILGANITDGYLYMDGDLIKFNQVSGTDGSLIKKVISTENVAFKNGSNQNVIRKVTAVIDPAGAALSTFTRVSPVFDANYIHTDVNFTLPLWAKLMAIEDLAEVNVQSDWNETNPASDTFIKNKPAGNLQTYLKKGSVIIGDIIASTDVRTISLGTDVGTSDYHVEGNLTGTFVGTDDGEASVTWITKRKTNISFDIIIYDPRNRSSQNFEFSYYINPY